MKSTKKLDKLSKSFGNISFKSGKLTNAVEKNTSSWIKNVLSIGAAIRVGRKIADLIELSNNYTENLNLFNVALGKYADEAKSYATEVRDVMGIDPSELMRNQGIFMNLATGFGVASERAYLMSKNLTQLGYDISSFYNTSVEDAMQKLQSGISGELEPLRRLGYDLSQAKLEETAFALGIEESVSAMTQAEKAQLRYYAIMTQVTQVQGDMSRTLESPANQLRIFSSSVTQAGRAIGNIFIPALNKALPYLIASLHVIEDIADAIARLLGFTMSDIEWDKELSFGEQMEEDIEGANGAAKKLKNFLMGFDELNVISADEGSGNGDDNGIGDFDFELPEYDFIDDAVNTKTAEIEEKLKNILGIGEDIDEWAQDLKDNFETIKTTAAAIGLALLGWKLTEGFISGLNTLNSIISKPIVQVTVGIALVAGGGETFIDGIKGIIEDGLDETDFSDIISGLLLSSTGSVLLGSKFAGWISDAFPQSVITSAFTSIAARFGIASAPLGGAILGGILIGIVGGIAMFGAGLYDAIKNELTIQNGELIVVGSTLAGAAIGAIFGPVGMLIGAGIGAAVGLVTDGVIAIVQNWDSIKEGFAKTWEGLVGWWNRVVKPRIDGAALFFQKLGWDIKEFAVGVKDSVVGTFNLLWNSLKKTINWIIGGFEGMSNGVIGGINSMISALNSLSFDVPDWVPVIGGEKFGFNIRYLNEVSFGRLETYARGGFPDEGELFVAREAGAEMVGSVGGKTAVANNDQIVEAVSAGVYQAVLSAMKQIGGENTPSMNVYLDGRQIASSVKRANKERGASILGNEVYSY